MGQGKPSVRINIARFWDGATAQEIINKLNTVSFVNGKKSQLIFTAFENDTQLSVRPASAFKGMKFVGLVHNADIDANFLLKITDKWLA